MSISWTIKGIALTAAAVAAAFGDSPRANADALPVAAKAFILPGASGDAWAPQILDQIDRWASDGSLVPQIDANYYSCGSGCTISVIPYPRTAGPLFGPNAPYADQSIAIGVNMTDQALQNATGPSLVAGLSLGSITADAVQASLVDNPDAPPPSQLTFIVSGDPSRDTPQTMGLGTLAPAGLYIPVLGWTVTRPPADSQYNTVVIVGEYDGSSDFPDRPWNLLADANAVTGMFCGCVHGPSALTSPSQVPPQNITVTTNANGATTTTYLVPTPTLPLVQPLQQIGVPAPIVNTLNTALTPIVEAGYSRNDAADGINAPYLQPTNGLPELVIPSQQAAPKVTSSTPKVTTSLKATPTTRAPSSALHIKR